MWDPCKGKNKWVVELILFAVVVVWLIRQFHGSRALRWQARARAAAPVVRVVAEDARAIKRSVTAAVRGRREVFRIDLDEEWKDLAGP